MWVIYGDFRCMFKNFSLANEVVFWHVIGCRANVGSGFSPNSWCDLSPPSPCCHSFKFARGSFIGIIHWQRLFYISSLPLIIQRLLGFPNCLRSNAKQNFSKILSLSGCPSVCRRFFFLRNGSPADMKFESVNHYGGYQMKGGGVSKGKWIRNVAAYFILVEGHLWMEMSTGVQDSFILYLPCQSKSYHHYREWGLMATDSYGRNFPRRI